MTTGQLVTPTFLLVFVGRVWPEVDRELGRWESLIAEFDNPALAVQAKASLDTKGFHCQGGSVFSLLYPPHSRRVTPLIVALQTISDYLDNLCDRAGVDDGRAMDALHDAMRDAVDPARPAAAYYRAYPAAGDGGYLQALVEVCRSVIADLPSFVAVKGRVCFLVDCYCRMQSLKHGPARDRERLLRDWIEPVLGSYPAVRWWEYAAACGSTLGVFALLAAACRPRLGREEVDALTGAYFPWINGLHILLDYFIDQGEDEAGGDLNFAACYSRPSSAVRGLERFLDRSLEEALCLPQSRFHLAVVRGLLALYLTDPRVEDQGLGSPARDVLDRGDARWQAAVCRWLRQAGRVRSGAPLTQIAGHTGQDTT